MKLQWRPFRFFSCPGPDHGEWGSFTPTSVVGAAAGGLEEAARGRTDRLGGGLAAGGRSLRAQSQGPGPGGEAAISALGGAPAAPAAWRAALNGFAAALGFADRRRLAEIDGQVGACRGGGQSGSGRLAGFPAPRSAVLLPAGEAPSSPGGADWLEAADVNRQEAVGQRAPRRDAEMKVAAAADASSGRCWPPCCKRITGPAPKAATGCQTGGVGIGRRQTSGPGSWRGEPRLEWLEATGWSPPDAARATRSCGPACLVGAG